MLRFALASVLILSPLAGIGHAQQPKPRPPCEQDTKKFCADVRPMQGGGTILCLVQHKDNLSAICRKALKLDS